MRENQDLLIPLAIYHPKQFFKVWNFIGFLLPFEKLLQHSEIVAICIVCFQYTKCFLFFKKALRKYLKPSTVPKYCASQYRFLLRQQEFIQSTTVFDLNWRHWRFLMYYGVHDMLLNTDHNIKRQTKLFLQQSRMLSAPLVCFKI